MLARLRVGWLADSQTMGSVASTDAITVTRLIADITFSALRSVHRSRPKRLC